MRNKTQYQGPKEAHILKSTKEGWVNVSMPYDPKCIEDIKSWIESSGRRWNPDTKFWEVKEIYLEQLITILKKHFGDNIIQNLTTEDTSSKNLFVPVFEALKVLPNGKMDQVYRSLAKACHPDVGGTDALMKLLNEAYQKVKQ